MNTEQGSVLAPVKIYRVRKPNKKLWGTVVIQAILIFASVVMIFPIIWTILSSFKTETEMFKSPPVWIPSSLSCNGYIAAFVSQPMTRFIFNTIVIAAGSIALSILIGTLAAFGFSRFSFKNKNMLLYIILAAMMFPGLTNLIPLYSVASRLNLVNTYQVMVILYIPWLLPMTIWIMKSFFDTIPKELDESAIIDGCNSLQVFWKVVLPISKPGLVAIIVMNFVNCWNEFLTAVIFLGPTEMKTITVGLYNFMGLAGNQYGPLLSAAVVALMPVVIIFLILRNEFMKGMLEGALKG